MMRRHTACAVGAVLGLLVGVAVVAHAQDPAAALGDPSSATLIDFLSAGGLPAVLAALGWVAGRWGGIPVAPVKVTVELSPDDRAELRRWRKARERDDSESDDPPPRAGP